MLKFTIALKIFPILNILVCLGKQGSNIILAPQILSTWQIRNNQQLDCPESDPNGHYAENS